MSKRRAAMFIVLGWYFAMTYPKDDSVGTLVLSLAVGSFGVLVVALVAYDLGRSSR